MSLGLFDYLEPKSTDEACYLLAKYQDQARLIAGGTDLLVQMKNRVRNPQYVVDLKSIPALDYITLNDNALHIGALASLRSIESSPVIQAHLPMLASAVNCIGSVQIRNLGTLVGNLCHASPSADTAPSLLCLNAKVKVVSDHGSYIVSIEDFFLGPGRTILGVGELVTEIQVPRSAVKSAGTYIKHSIRRAMDLSLVGVATFFGLDQGRMVDIRIGLGAVAPIPMRAKKAEAILEGNIPSDDLIAEAARVAAEEAKPISDIRSSDDYRRRMVEVQTRRAVKQTLQSFGQQS